MHVRVQALKLFLEINSGLLHFRASYQMRFYRSHLRSRPFMGENAHIFFHFWKMWFFHLQSHIFPTLSITYWWNDEFLIHAGCLSWLMIRELFTLPCELSCRELNSSKSHWIDLSLFSVFSPDSGSFRFILLVFFGSQPRLPTNWLVFDFAQWCKISCTFFFWKLNWSMKTRDSTFFLRFFFPDF